MGNNSGNSYLVCKNFFVINMLSAFDVCYIYSSALQIRFYHGSKDYEPLGAVCQIWVQIVCTKVNLRT